MLVVGYAGCNTLLPRKFPSSYLWYQLTQVDLTKGYKTVVYIIKADRPLTRNTNALITDKQTIPVDW